MQPNNPQGLNQPGQNQPVPIAPPQPPAPAGLQPLSITPVIDPAALQAALDEPAPQQAPQAPAPVVEEPTSQPVVDQIDAGDDGQEGDEEEYDGEPLTEPVTWMAHEYIHQEKGTMWFLIFGVVVVALIAVSIFLMGSWSFAVLLAVIAVVVIVYSRRPPRELTYSLDDEGLTIDGKMNLFSGYKSFGVIQDGEHFSVMLIPTQRFQPGTTVYFPEEAGEDIVDILGSRLPMKELKLDAVDRVVRILRL